jgi:PAS domain S-box-containing protein
MCLPLVLLALIGLAFLKLQTESTEQLRVVARAEKCIALLNLLNQDVYELMIIVTVKNPKAISLTDINQFRGVSQSIDSRLQEIETVSEGDPDVRQMASDARDLKQKMISLLARNRETYSEATNGLGQRISLKDELNQLLFKAMRDFLPKIAEKQHRFSSVAPSIYANLRARQDGLILFVIISESLLSVTLAAIISRSLTTRIERLVENTSRLASRLPLNPPAEGSDELAILDQSFQRLAKTLMEKERRESVFIENAYDIIVTIDRQKRITGINLASAAKLGFAPDALIGQCIFDLVDAASQEKLGNTMDALIDGTSAVPLELQIRKKDGLSMDALIALQWFSTENLFLCIIHDVTAQREAERIKSNVVAMVSHDLKTPLATVDNVLKMLDNPALADKRDSYLAMAKRNIRRVLGLVVDFLDVERLESSTFVLHKKVVSVSEIYKVVEEAVIGVAEEKHVTVNFDQSDETVYGDFECLVRVLTNLVTNAVNYSPEGEIVHVCAKKAGGAIEFFVKDHGPGIPLSERERIFEKFYQLSDKQKASSGLGLTTCKYLVELGGGKIKVDSHESAGSIFSFTVPRNDLKS